MVEMEERRWEDLDPDCLSNVLGRVGMESLLLDVPFVCKKWYKATLNPLCWQHIVFPHSLLESRLYQIYQDSFLPPTDFNEDDYDEDGDFDEEEIYHELPTRSPFNYNGLVKFIGKRSQKCATSLVLPTDFSEEELLCLADECLALRFLVVRINIVPGLVSKWKNLEILRLDNGFNVEETLLQVRLHCNNFVGLCVTSPAIYNNTAQDFINSLPSNIKYLVIKKDYFGTECLVTILQGLKELDHFDVRECEGFEVDEEILRIATHIHTFLYEYEGGPGPNVCSDKYLQYLYSDYDCGWCNDILNSMTYAGEIPEMDDVMDFPVTWFEEL